MDEIKVSVVKYADRPSFLLRYIDPLTGKRNHKSAETNSKRDAERAAAKWEAELREGRYCGSRITWADFRLRYENEVLASLAATTDKKVSGVFNAVEKYLAPTRLNQLTAERLSGLQSKLRDAGLAESTIKGHLAHLLAALNWAVTVRLLAKAPEIKMPRRAKGANVMKGRPISGEEFDRMLAAVGKVLGEPNADAEPPELFERAKAIESWRHYLRGLWLSGLRLAESLELSWDRDDKLRVDFQPGELPMLRIPAALEKGNQDRLLPMAPEFAEFLQQTPEAQRSGYVFNPRPQREWRSIRLGPGRVGRTIAAIGVKAGIKAKTDASTGATKFASAHDLRRSFGLRWASRVFPQTLMELMRHESIDTTMRYYVGRNAQSTAAVLWEAHRAATGNSFGNSGPKTKKQPATASDITAIAD